MKRLHMWATVAPLIALVVALAAAAGAKGAPKRASGTMQLQSTFAAAYKRRSDYCPPGTPPSVLCYRFVGINDVPGLGHATETYTNTWDERVCPPDRPISQFRTAVIEVAGKGRIDLSLAAPYCGPFSPAEVGPLEGTITGGSGTYEGASGSVQFRASVSEYLNPCHCGTASDTWTGTLTVPGLEFDLTPPVLKGAVSKTVRAPKKARRVRVRYTVTARDAVDASVPVACKPRSGSRFKLGRTVVNCSATDSSANTATAKFRITVKKRR